MHRKTKAKTLPESVPLEEAEDFILFSDAALSSSGCCKSNTMVKKNRTQGMTGRKNVAKVPVLKRLDLGLDFARSIYNVEPFSRSNTIPWEEKKKEKKGSN